MKTLKLSLAILIAVLFIACDCIDPDIEKQTLEGTYLLKATSKDNCDIDLENEWNDILNFLSQPDEGNQLSISELEIDADGSFILTIFQLSEIFSQDCAELTYSGNISENEFDDFGKLLACIENSSSGDCDDIIFSKDKETITWDWDLNDSCNSQWTWKKN